MSTAKYLDEVCYGYELVRFAVTHPILSPNADF